MRIRKTIAVVGSTFTLFACFILYMRMDSTISLQQKFSITEELHDNKWLHFENRLQQLENDLNKHHEEVGEIKQAIKVLVPAKKTTKDISVSSSSSSRALASRLLSSEMIYSDTCPLQVDSAPRTNIQMLEMYKKLKFDNIDGGVWKQGWKIEIDPLDWNKQHKLKVFVVPHSHNDPGWLRTLDEYYLSQTKHILNNMLIKLPEDSRRKFIWAEISYFSMWWDDLDESERETVKRLLRSNQLEIVTGGWVMNDEANSHWISIIHQMTEGHQWLKINLNYTPKSHWSIDPFGMSPTEPRLLKEMGLENMLIQRIHYSVKKQLSKQKSLEFRWKQVWDNTGKTEMFTHMMPFYSYDIPHSCGPDPKICCQFDFKRLPGHGLQCPWKIAPEPITDTNVPHKAELLLDQYRKKSTLFRTNVLLVPLGDDFRYSHSTEWDCQYQNYQKLFDFMNSNRNMHVQIQFGTLTDYFNALHAESNTHDFPTLTGDFFTYSDRDDHYWSGYYTSRPFYKRLDRVLLYYVRAAEIILTIAHLSEKPGSQWIINQLGLEKVLIDARRALALFQHHDGITGTAKDHVVIDYGKRMLQAIKISQNVIQHCTNLLLLGPNIEKSELDAIHYNIDDIRHNHDSLAERHTITIGPELSIKRIAIYNSLPFVRHEVVTFVVSTPFIKVLNFKSAVIKCQVSPVFEYISAMSQSKYEVSFIANVPAFGLVSYTINAILEQDVPPETSYSSIKIYNQYLEVAIPAGFTDVHVFPSASEFTIQNARITASFSNLGLLKALKIARTTIPVHLDFAKYGVRRALERSGAYLFLPDGDATPIQIENTIVKVITGPILSSVMVQLPYVHHTVSLFNSPGADSLGLEMHNLVKIEKTSNFEIAMRFSTNIKNANEYFTDINGYQILRRKQFAKLPLQANYYPMPTMAYIEDKSTRLTILTGSPLGCASLREGHIEVMLDRRLAQDDNLGLGQGVLDNHPTKHIFRILLERKTHKCEATSEDHPAGFPSLSAHVASESLLNPLTRMLRANDEEVVSSPVYSSVNSDMGVDFGIPSLRSDIMINYEKYVGVIVNRQNLDLCFADRILLQQFPLSNGSVKISAVLPHLNGNMKFNKSTLSFLSIKESVDYNGDISLCPMDIQAFVLHR